jgi:Xaa-Pro dipeptidase
MHAAGANGDGVEVFCPFDASEYAERLSSVRERMAANELDALVLTAPDSVYYLTNYQTPGNPFTVLVVPLAAPMHLFTRGLEGTNVKYRSTTAYTCYDEGEAPEALVTGHLATLEKPGHARVGYEASSPRLTVGAQRTLEALYPSEWLDASDLVLELRAVKSEAEVVCTRRAAQLVLDGYQAGVKVLTPGTTETAVAGEIQRGMMKGGAECAAASAPPRARTLARAHTDTHTALPLPQVRGLPRLRLNRRDWLPRPPRRVARRRQGA